MRFKNLIIIEVVFGILIFKAIYFDKKYFYFS